MRILLDTSAYSNFLRGNTDVRNHIHSAEVLIMSVFVMAELKAGFMNGNRPEQNLSLLSKFLSKASVIEIQTTPKTADHFAQIKQGLRESGSPIPTNDIWIAAHSVESNSKLVTFDHHFTKVKDLDVVLLT